MSLVSRFGYRVAMCVLAGTCFAQRVELRQAPEVAIPFRVDGNSPAVWRDGRFHFFTSDGTPVTVEGADQFSLSGDRNVVVDRADHLPMWIEPPGRTATGPSTGGTTTNRLEFAAAGS